VQGLTKAWSGGCAPGRAASDMGVDHPWFACLPRSPVDNFVRPALAARDTIPPRVGPS
jgi:hypothetical protein